MNTHSSSTPFFVWNRGLPRGALVVVLVILLYFGYQPDYAKGIGHVQFIDIGQGDSTLITTPSGLHILVDGEGLYRLETRGELARTKGAV